MELHIKFNPTMGKVLMWTDDRQNVEECDLNYFSEIGSIVQDYAIEYISSWYNNPDKHR